MSAVDSAAPVAEKLLGAEINAYSSVTDVIGDINQSMTGNTILRIGHLEAAKPGYWVSGVAHIALTPSERERLIAILISHREAHAGVSV